ncbi:hypothetical protein Hdeb2414_s0043g00741461 [Helianthus debilis subsp. tardiflorus]
MVMSVERGLSSQPWIRMLVLHEVKVDKKLCLSQMCVQEMPSSGTGRGTEGSGGDQETITQFVNRKKLEEAKRKLDMEAELKMSTK